MVSGLIRTGGCPGYEPLGAEERANVEEVIASGHLTFGKFGHRFEAALARWFGVKYAVAVNSGSSANLLAVASLFEYHGWRPGDEVITVAAGFPTTVAPLVQLGLVPVFVDVTLRDACVHAAELKHAISNRTRALFLPHTLGMVFDVKTVLDLCEEHNLCLIEDNCDAAGAVWAPPSGIPKRTGTIGHVGTLSFYPAHHMTTAEGGALLTNDDKVAKIAESLRDWGKDCWCPPNVDNTCRKRFSQQHGTLPFGYDHKYISARLGYNLKMTDVQAAIGCAQVDRLDAVVAARRENWSFYHRELASVLGVVSAEPREQTLPSPFGFLMISTSRDVLVKKLEEAKIQTRPLFAGNIIRHPAMVDVRHRVVGPLRNTDSLMNFAFWIGVHPNLTAEQKGYVVDQVKKAIK